MKLYAPLSSCQRDTKALIMVCGVAWVPRPRRSGRFVTVGGVRDLTRKLWVKQNQHDGDCWRLFTAVGEAVDAVDAQRVLYPGSFVDVTASFVFPSVTYVDVDHRAPRFFEDVDGVNEIIAAHRPSPWSPTVAFLHADYTDPLDLPDAGFDLLISLYAGFVSEHCTRYLRVGGTLLVNPSHGDAAMASIDDRYRLLGVVHHRDGRYSVAQHDLDAYLVPKKPVEITAELLRRTQRGIAYTTSPFAYLFERIS